jgi:hypothetical protein
VAGGDRSRGTGGPGADDHKLGFGDGAHADRDATAGRSCRSDRRR